MLGYVAAGVGILMAGKVIWMIDDWGRDFISNHAELSATNPDKTLRPILTQHSVSEVETAVERWVDSQSTWAIHADSATTAPENSLGQLHLTRTTPVLRFVDDIEVRIAKQSNPQQTVLTAQSQSRIGKGDLGQNPRNLRILRKGVLEELK